MRKFKVGDCVLWSYSDDEIECVIIEVDLITVGKLVYLVEVGNNYMWRHWVSESDLRIDQVQIRNVKLNQILE